MFRTTIARRRLAALASGGLLAGGLVAAPAMAGLSTAAAAPVTLDYTCAATTSFGVLDLPGTVTIETTTPASAAAGSVVATGVTVTADFGALPASVPAAFVPTLSGSFDIPLTLGTSTATFTTPTQTAPRDALVYTGDGSVDLTAPDAAGEAPITVGTIVGNFSAGTTALPATCTPDAGQDLTVGSLTVADDGPVDPEGILYSCSYGSFPTAYEAILEVAADLPESTDQGSGLDPDLDTTLTWTEEASDGFRAIGLGVEEGSATLNLDTAAGQAEGVAAVPFDETDIPEAGEAVWTGAGSYGVLDTSVPGELALTVGDATIDLRATVMFTPGVYTDATFTCAVAEGQDTTIGTVTVNETSGPVAVAGKVKIKGNAKVGKTLRAVPGKAAGADVTYQWLANGKAIKKATGKKLKLRKSHQGKKVSVRATYSQDGFFDVVQTSKAVKVKKAKKKK